MKKLSKKEQTELLYLGAGVITVVTVFLLIKKIRNRKIVASSVAPSGIVNISPGSSASGYTKKNCDKNTVLQKGIECDAVMYAQRQINMIFQNLGISKLLEDGKFGQATENAFIKLVNKPTATYSEIVEARKQIKPN